MSSLTCTDEMYLAFMASMGQADFQNEAVKDWIKNGIEAALGAMPVEVAGYADDNSPLFTHPDATTARLIERQLRVFAHALKSLCKDFSDLQNRPYMGDVTSAIDRMLEHAVEDLNVDPKCRPAAMTGARFASMALGLPYKHVESQARLVADAAAEKINLLNGVGAPKPESEGKGLKGKGGHICSCETACPPPAMRHSRYRLLQNGEDQLTVEEHAAGWFFDDDYDGLLANRRWPGHEGF